MWKTYKLSDIGTVVGGATPSTTVEKFYGGDIPWLTPKDLSGFKDRYIERGERNITQEGLNSCSAHLLPENSVLFSSRAPIGYVAIAKNPIATNQGFKSIIPNANVDSLFLYYALKYNKEKIEAMGSGTTFKEVSGAIMKSFEISLPPLEEQRRIAGILGAIDDKIECNRRINANLELQAQALFEKMFFANNEKERGLLSSYANINPVRSLQQGVNARYIEMANLPTKGSFPADWTFKLFNGGVKFTNGDTIMARITPCLENGKIAYIDFLESEEVAFGSTEYIVISAKDGYCPALFYFLARNKEFVDYAVGHMNGSSGRQRVSCVDIANFPMPNMLIEESNEFSLFAMPIMDVIRRNSLENRTLATLRDTLLPKLMNGEM